MDKLQKSAAKIKNKFPDYRFSWEILTEIILENVEKKPYWLDIGAGPNILIEEQPGAEFAVGFDIEKPGKVLINQANAYCLGSANELPFKNARFDFITSRYTFEHLESPVTALGDIERAMKPGALFVMQTTNVRSPMIIISRLIPFSLKKQIFRIFFKEIPSGVFKTYYRMNRPSQFKKQIGSLKLEKIYLVEDILCHNSIFFGISFLLYRIIRWLHLDGIKSNIIVVYRKE